MTRLYPSRDKTHWVNTPEKASWDIQSSLMFCTDHHQVVAYIYTEQVFGSQPKKESYWWTVNVQLLENREDGLHFITTCSSVIKPKFPEIGKAQLACDLAVSKLLKWLPTQ